MAYSIQTWANTSAGGTRLNATRLNHMEAGINDAHTIADAAAVDAATATANATTALTNANAAQTSATAAQSTADTALATANASLGASAFTAKGHIIVGTGPSTADGLPVGANDQILQADSSTSTGVKWGPKITYSTTAPSSPAVGDIWLDPAATAGGGGGGTNIDQFRFYPTAVEWTDGPGKAQTTAPNGVSPSGMADPDASAYQVDNLPTFVHVINDPLGGQSTMRLVEKDALNGNWKWSDR